jgi:hypothetical protein
MQYYAELYGRAGSRSYFPTGKTGKDWDELENERNEMRDWIMQAAPMLSVASCIVIDEAVGRLGEIEGCRGMLELCPVDFINLENVQAHLRARKESK